MRILQRCALVGARLRAGSATWLAALVLTGCAGTASLHLSHSIDQPLQDVSVSPDGVAFAAIDSPWTIQAQGWDACGNTTSFTRKGSLLGSAVARFELSSASDTRPGLQEWYGVESRPYIHGLTIRRLPHCHGGQPLSVWLQSSLDLRAGRDLESYEVLSRSGVVAAKYRGLKAFAADGSPISHEVQLVDSRHLKVTLQLADAVFPLTIDPWIQLAGTGATEGNRGAQALAISADERWSAIGTSTSDGQGPTIFRKQDGTWRTFQQLDPPIEAVGSRFGVDAVFSGAALAISALRRDKGGEAGVFVFAPDASGYWRLRQVIEAADPNSSNLVLAGDPDWLVVASHGEAWQSGGVLDVFSWTKQGLKPWSRLVGPAKSQADGFGRALSVSNAALFVSAPFANVGAPQSGSVHVYDLNHASPRLLQTIQAPRPELRAQFGTHLVSNMRWLVVADAHGALWVYAREAGRLALAGSIESESAIRGSLLLQGDRLLVRTREGGSSVFDLNTLEAVEASNVAMPADPASQGPNLAAERLRSWLALLSKGTSIPSVFHDGFEQRPTSQPPQIQWLEPAANAFLNQTRPLIRIAFDSGGAAIDPASRVFTVDGVPLSLPCSQAGSDVSGEFECRPTTDLGQGPHTLGFSISNVLGTPSNQLSRSVTIDSIAPAAIPLSAVSVSPIANGWRVNVLATALESGAELIIRVQGFGLPAVISSAGADLVAELVTSPGDSILIYARDAAGNESAPLAITPGLPPPPEDIAPELDDGGASGMLPAIEFLFTPPNPIQIDVDPQIFDPVRTAVVRGKVLARNGSPLPGVRVVIADRAEYGYTLTRDNGEYDLAVNGGETLVLEYRKSGHLFAQRQTEVPWHDFVVVENVVLVELDAKVSRIEVGSALPQIANGGVSADESGSRQPAVYFPPGVQAEMILADGSTQPLDHLDVRLTEYTVGANGPAAMPSPMPPTTAYTYAVELSVDQALQEGTKIGGRDVLFDRPVALYVDNFLDFPVGEGVPTGYYDNTAATWIAVDDGRILGLLGVSDGLAILDMEGGGLAATEAEMLAEGIDDNERRLIAQRFAQGQSFWRVQISHFSTWDCNWPFGPPIDVVDHFIDWLLSLDKSEEEPCVGGCEIGASSRNLAESIDIPGLPGGMRYDSSRLLADGGSFGPKIDLTLTPAEIPSSMKRVDLEIHLLGRVFKTSYLPSPNLSASIPLVLLDPYFRSREGSYPMKLRVGYVYEPVLRSAGGGGSSRPRSFGSVGALPMTGNRERMEIVQWWEDTSSITYQSAMSQRETAGWQLRFQHVLDVSSGTMMMGNGRTVSAAERPELLGTLAGSAVSGSAADGAAAIGNTLNTPSAIAFDARGRMFVADTGSHRVRRVDADGRIFTVAGVGSPGYGGDNGPAPAAVLNSPSALAFDAQGRLYIADRGNHRIRRIEADGRMVTFAGTGTAALAVEGEPASQSPLNAPRGVATNRHGHVYISDSGNRLVWDVQPDGRMLRIAGGGSGSGPRGIDAVLSNPGPLAADGEGDLYLIDADRVHRVRQDGMIHVAAGGGTNAGANNVPAIEAQIAPAGIAVDSNERLLIADSGFHRIRRVNGNGVIVTLGGTGATGYAINGIAARKAPVDSPRAIAVDKTSRVVFAHAHAVRFIGRESAASIGGEISVADPSGEVLHVFNPQGRHLRTIDALTGGLLYALNYTDGALVSMVDAFGNTTRIQRDAGGRPIGILSADNLQTGITLDTRGYLASVITPEGHRSEFGYTTQGLLLSMKNPRLQQWDYGYDADGRLVSDDRPDGSGWTIAHRPQGGGSETDFTSRLGRVTTYGLSYRPDGTEVRYSRQPDGSEDYREINANRDVTALFADGSTTLEEMQVHPRFGVQALLPSSSVVETPLGLRAEVTQTYTAIPAGARDPADLVSWQEVTSVNGREFSLLFDKPTMTFTSTTPEGRSALMQVDAQRRPLRVQVPGLAELEYDYDTRGRLEAVRQSDGVETREYRFAYDAFGYLSEVTDPLERSVEIINDRDGRPTLLRGPDGREIILEPDPNGNITALTTPKGPIHRFGYDPVDRENHYEAPPLAGAPPTVTDTAFDADGNPDDQTLPGGIRVDFSYDAFGRLTSASRPAQEGDFGNEVRLDYTHDGFLQTGETLSGTVNGAVEFGYDNDFRLRTLTSPDAVTTYAFDDDGQLTGAQTTGSDASSDLILSHDPDNGLLQGTVVGPISDEWTWSSFAEPSAYEARAGPNQVFHTSFIRDKLGRITQKTETVLGVTHVHGYRYDLAGRLDQVTLDGNITETYTYDANGNRETLTRGPATTTYHYDPQDRLLSQGDCSYTYTANGELETQTCAGQTTRYRYSIHGDLTAVTLPDGRDIEYVVDARGRRVGKRIDGELIQGLICADQLNPVAELDGSGAVVATFVYADRGHVPSLMHKAGQTYRIVSDYLGSVRLVIDTATGAVAQRIDYDAWGRVLSDTNPGFQPFGYAGGIDDRDTGLVRFGARDYSADNGRWVSKDPIGFGGGDYNIYLYSFSNPVNFIDPDGLEAFFEFGYSGGFFAGPAGMTVSVTVGLNTNGTFRGTQSFFKMQANPMLGAGYFVGVGGTAGGGFNPGPLAPGMTTGTTFHVEGGAAGGVPFTGGFAGDVGIELDAFSGGKAIRGLGEGLYIGEGLSPSVTFSSPLFGDVVDVYRDFFGKIGRVDAPCD